MNSLCPFWLAAGPAARLRRVLALALFVALAAYGGRAHAQRAGTWTDTSHFTTPVLSKAVQSVAASAYCFHAVLVDGTLVSWGDDTFGEVSDTPKGTFKAVACGDAFAIALRTDGTIVSWGWDSDQQISNSPSGTFKAIAAGSSHGLAIRTDGTLATWGKSINGMGSPPPGTFVAIAGGLFHSVALRSDGQLFEWGFNGFGELNGMPSGTFIGVAVADNVNAALRSDGTVAMWGQGVNQYTPVPSGTFTKIVGGCGACFLGFDPDGKLVPFGFDEFGTYMPSNRKFQDAAVNRTWAIGIETVCVPVSLTLDQSTMVGGNTTFGTVTMSSPAPAGGIAVPITASNAPLTSQPAQVIVPEGATQMSFAIDTSAVSSKSSAVFRVRWNRVNAESKLVVTTPQIYGISVPAWATGPATVTATLTISDPAPAGGLTVSLTSSNTSAATVPATVTIPAGSTSVNFDVTCKYVSKPLDTKIKATRAGSGLALAYLRVY